MECRVFSHSCSALTRLHKRSRLTLSRAFTHYLPYREYLKSLLGFPVPLELYPTWCTCVSAGCFLDSLPLPTIFELHWSLWKSWQVGTNLPWIWGTQVFHTLKGALTHPFLMPWNVIMSYFLHLWWFPSPFYDRSEESNLCPSQPGGYISYWILVYWLTLQYQLFSPKIGRIL